MRPGDRRTVRGPAIASVIAFDLNETLLDLGAWKRRSRSCWAAPPLRPQWFGAMLQVASTGGLTSENVDFTAAQRAALATQRHEVPLSTSELDGLVDQMSSLPAHPDVPGALAALA